MAFILRQAIVNNPTSAGAIINQISILANTPVAMTSISSINVVNTAEQYQYEVSVAGA